MKESILLLGHGSPKKDANKLEQVGTMLHGMLHAGCTEDCVRVAYLQFAQPGIMDTISECVKRGAKKVILHPFFLSSGMHVTKDIPGMIEEARALFPDVKFIYTEPLGVHEKLAHIVMERISAAEQLAPSAIEKRSFDILSAEADLSGIPAERLPIVQRVIHATADFDFKDTLMFHPDAVERGLAAIKSGKDILTDVEMVKTGINKKWLAQWGGKVICNIQNTGAQGVSGASGVGSSESGAKTKAETGIEAALRENHNIGIIAIGNAPTALIRTIELLSHSGHPALAVPLVNAGARHPALAVPLVNAGASHPAHAGASLRTRNSGLLVIGVPVGFVKAVESKALLAAQQFPFITAAGRKGGTPVAVAIVNALLKMANDIK